MADPAARDLAKKMKLEARFKPKLRKFFNQIGKDVNAVWTATRSIPNLSTFNLEMVALLREHYRAVSRSFDTTTRTDIKSGFLDLVTKQEENIDKSIVEFINQHSQQQADFILRTTERDLNKISRDVITGAATQGLVLTNAEIGTAIEDQFDETSDNRVGTIATTETQTPAETIKFLEATAVASVLAIVPGTQELFKTWNTVLDERTRLSHVEADRQRVPVNQPFRVQGQQLMVPGDTSLGASISNIANCRCSAVFDVQGEESPPLDIPRQLL